MLEYYSKNGVSQSELKKYLGHPRNIDLSKFDDDDIYTNEDSALSKGSIVDLLCTNADAQKIIDENYLPSVDVNLSDTIKNIVRSFHHRVSAKGNDSLSDYPDVLHEICNDQGYYMNRAKPDFKEDKRVSDIIDNDSANKYLDYLKKAEGKILISQENLEKAYTIANCINSNETFMRFKDVDTISYQYPFFRTHNVMYNDVFYEVPVKGLLDVMLIDHKRKIVRIVDIKAIMGKMSSFYNSIFKFRYDIQGSFYANFIREELIEKGLKDYSVEFYNLAGSYSDPEHTEMFAYPERVLYTAKVGKPSKHVLGWDNLMYRKMFYEENGFKYTPEYISSGGMNIVEMFEDKE